MKQNVLYDSCIKNVFALVIKYFKDKVDKGGQPYVNHLYRVAESVYDKHKNIKLMIIAYLHDILEDTKCTIPELEDAGCDEEIIEAILAITRKPDETKYFDFIKRVKKNPMARLVKIADLEDNMNITRLTKFGEYEKNRLTKYWYSRKYLTDEFTEKQCSQIKDMK